MRFNSLIKILTGISLLVANAFAWAESKYNMPVGVTPMSHDIYRLHMLVFWVCVGIGVVVFSVLIYALIMHRKSRGVVAANFHEHPGLEITWTIIPFIILVLMAIPATLVLMKMTDNSKSDLSIKITGYQWKWRYEYLNQNINFFSNISTPQDQIHNQKAKNPNYLLEVDNPMVVPIHKKIRFLVTANDVIHSWWVPALGVKTDAIPGFIHDSWAWIEKPGIYRGQCAELCGMNHAFMPIVVVALPQEDFDKWVQERKMPTTLPPVMVMGAPVNNSLTAQPVTVTAPLTKEALMEKGKKTYETICAVCHKSDGTGMPPTFKPLKGSPIVTGAPKEHILRVLNGVPGTTMQAFGPQLSDEEIAAVITYERNAFGNDNQTTYGKQAGGIVQPADVAAARKQ